MDLGSPASLISGLLIGLLGTAFFIYGKKQERPLVLFTGVFLCLFPMFIASVLAQWLVTGACCTGLFVASRNN
ncbi:MAG: hypothetical protein K2Y21_07380 [Phycisphaerales bacterium]|nr:hypothetical protein [Phycisphaerales bacterium]